MIYNLNKYYFYMFVYMYEYKYIKSRVIPIFPFPTPTFPHSIFVSSFFNSGRNPGCKAVNIPLLFTQSHKTALELLHPYHYEKQTY